MALTHNSKVADSEPTWSSWIDTNRSKLPNSAFADSKNRKFPHHWVKNGKVKDGKFVSGDMYLHKGGLNAAWAYANGARSGKRASQSVINHLQRHRKALGLKSVYETITNSDKIKEFFDSIGRNDLSEGIDFTVSVSKSIKKKGLKELLKSKKGKNLYKPKSNDRYIDGYATTPDIDWVKDSVTLEAIQKAEKHLLRKGTNTVFFNHDTDKPIGKVVGTLANEQGLFVQILISKAKDVEDIWTKIKEGILSSFSIRFLVKKVEIERDEKDGTILSYNIKEMEMLEVSVVGLPMNKEANIENVVGKSYKHNKGEQKMSKKELVTEIVKEVFEDELKDEIKETVKEIFNDELKDEFKGLIKEVLDEKNKEKSSDEDNKEDKSKDKGKEDKDDKSKSSDKDDAIKLLVDEIKSLKEALSKKSVEDKDDKNTKKSVEDNEDNEEDKNKSSDKVVLKDINDEETCKFVLKAMEDEILYDKLTEKEKNKCKQIYFQILKANKLF